MNDVKRAWNAKPERNRAIYDLRKAGWSYTKIARRFKISPARVYSILHTNDWPEFMVDDTRG